MIDAVSQLGILMLLLLTGMETDLRLVKKARRAAISTSAAGIIVPFACGFALGELLPATMLPKPDQRIITSLFLGTALSIASVKIVAMVVREMGFMRRNVGITLIASAIIDDTIGWVIVAIISGLAVHGQVDALGLGESVLGTAIFLAVSFTLGRRLLASAGTGCPKNLFTEKFGTCVAEASTGFGVCTNLRFAAQWEASFFST
jgi:Kef-type K+ transport system membrane component KefB